MKYLGTVCALAALLSLVAGQDPTFSPAKPPAIPLAVKSPYMNTWLECGSDYGPNSGGNLAGYWPRFWAGNLQQQGPVNGEVLEDHGSVTGWAGLIRVDGAVYTWMGAPQVNGNFPTNVDQTAFEYTSARSTFISNVAGKVSVNATFVNPVTPTDMKRMSIIGTYLSVTVASLDGASHEVELYADTSAEWISIHSNDEAKWSYSVDSNNVASHQISLADQTEFNTDYPDDAAHWGNWYWSTASTSSLSIQSGADMTVRGAFINNGKLANTQDTNYRAINDSYPVFGFANELGNVGSTPVSVVYTLVHAQQNAIQFDGANGLEPVPSLWTSYFSSDAALVDFFYNDWTTHTGATDHKFAIDSLAAGGQDYLTITSLSARQAFAGVQLAGTTDKPYLFLKEISSDGNIQTVDVIFPSVPIFLYSNPILVKYLLDPLYENQEAGKFPQTYSIHDLGENYPRAVGHPTGDGEMMPIEECGNMLAMTLAYAQRANDNAYLTQHYPILKQWTGYLVNDSLTPGDQLSTDDFQGTLANQTNLALKGILGIQAMSVIAGLTGNTADQQSYANTASSYIKQWMAYAIVNAQVPHTNLQYGNPDSHGLLYNLYIDKLLGLNLVPQSVYDMQSAFYPTIADTFGVQLDSRNLNTKSDWQMWVASIASDSTKQLFISGVANFVKNSPTNRAFSDLFNVHTGDSHRFVARPVVGGHFALLALNGAPTSAAKAAADNKSYKRAVKFEA